MGLAAGYARSLGMSPGAGRRPRWRVVVALLAITLLLGGCGGSAITITPVPLAVLEAILAYFVTRKALRLEGGTAANREHRHRGFFVWRRARHLGERNATWVTEPDQPTLKQRMESEYDAVEAYLDGKIGTRSNRGPFYGGTDPVAPAHIDLADVARRYINQNARAASVLRQTRDNVESRRIYTNAIVWRATALHDDLWQPAPDGRTATLKTIELDEIVDRRLRVVERMSHNVADATSLGGRRWPRVLASATSGWRDGFRIRMFEYPRVPRIRVFDTVLAGSTSWRLGERGTRYEYVVAQTDGGGNTRYAGINFPASQTAHWRSSTTRSYNQFLVPSGRTGAQVIDDMFIANPPNKWEDWWGRTWLWCDHVIAAIHLDALLLGKRRREGNDDSFNSLVTGRQNYVFVGPVVGSAGRAVDNDRLLADNADPYFENTVIGIDDLQVGDHLIFWNSFIYTMISTGDWRLENALVMTIDSDPRGGVRLAGAPPTLQLSLQGHGTGRIPYGRFTEVIASKLRGAMIDVQNQIRQAVAADATLITDPAKRRLTYRERGDTQLVWWSPYESFRSPGAWWIEIPESQYQHWGFQSIEETVEGIRKSVGHDGGSASHLINDGSAVARIPLGPGYNPPPVTGAAYFPVFEPRVADAWNGYLRSRASNGTFRAPQRLAPLVVDGSIMPGLFYRGISRPIPMVRPKVN